MAVSLGSIDGTQSYRIVGDNSSLTSILHALNSSSCAAVLGTTYAFQPAQFIINSDNLSRPHPEEIFQYYRASSFALSLDGYNNTMALSSNAPTSNGSMPAVLTQTPLPSNLNTTLLTCLNTTIGNNLPLVDPSSHALSYDAIGAIIVACVVGLALLVLLVVSLLESKGRFWKFTWLFGRCRRRKRGPGEAADRPVDAVDEVHTSPLTL